MKTEIDRYKKVVAILTEALKQYSHPDSTSVCDVLAHVEEILAPPVEMEDVPVTSWAIIAPSGFIETTSTNEGLQRDQVCNEHSPFYGYQVIKLTGILTRPKPVPVERSVRLVFSESGIWSWPDGHPDLRGKTCILTYMD